MLKCIILDESLPLRGYRGFCQRGSNFATFFLVYVGGGTISGPSWARQLNAIQMTFCWRDEADPTLNAGLVAVSVSKGSGPVLLRNPIFF